MNQLSIFDVMYPKYKITKPIKLIELFGGYGSQYFALKYLGANVEHHKLVEWAAKSIQAYNDAHIQDYNDYSKELTDDEVIDKVTNWGVSLNYNEPATREQIKRQNYRKIYNNIIATNDLVDISRVKGADLEITDAKTFTYLLTYSFPCQDLSLGGKGKGMAKGSGTRSGLLWEVERILDECKEINELPQVLLMENVPQVHGEGNTEDFIKWQSKLESLGYKNYWKDLIATDYGIPQTRNRCFMISILGDYSYTFPQPIPLKLKLKDMLENEVDEKYYLSDAMINYIYSDDNSGKYNRLAARQSCDRSIEKGIAATITTTAEQRPTDNFIKDTPNYIEWKEKGKLDSDCRAAKEEKVSLTITTSPKAKVLIKNNTKKGYLEATEGDGIDISSRMEHHRGTVQKDKVQTLTTSCDVGVCVGTYQYSKSNNFMKGKDRLQLGKEVSDTLQTTQKEEIVNSDLRIRKLTPRECFRLMGVKDEDFEHITKNQSNASLYHLAGDSIVIDVLMAIFKELL